MGAGNEAPTRRGEWDSAIPVLRYLRRGAILLVAIAITLIAVRVYEAQREPR
jgi:hypothetical protein